MGSRAETWANTDAAVWTQASCHSVAYMCASGPLSSPTKNACDGDAAAGQRAICRGKFGRGCTLQNAALEVG